MINRTRQKVLITIVTVGLLVGLPAVSLYYMSRGNEARNFRLVKDFSFTDIHGRTMDPSVFEDHITLASFGYLGCGSTCDAINDSLAAYIDEFSKQGIPMQGFSLTIDPENDSREDLISYSAKFCGDCDNWFWGRDDDKIKIETAINGRFFSRVKMKDGILQPDLKIAIVNQEGYIRGYFNIFEEKDRRKFREQMASLASILQN